MLVAIAPLLVAAAGLLLWALASGIIKTAGEGAYYIGLFFVVGVLAKSSVHVGGMIVAFAPLLVAVAGILIWALAANAIAKRAGAGAFFIGLFYIVAALANHTVKIG